MKITFGGHEVFLHSSGAMFWPGHNTLIVSDLHLEKGSHFARRGYFLPPYDTHKTLEELITVCGLTECEKLVLLGDCFHDEEGYHRLNKQDRILFDLLRAYNPVWIYGNHDGEFVPEGFQPMHDMNLDGLIFRHEAQPGAVNEVSGHYHPKMEIGSPRRSLSCRCFVEDGNKLILPAFGNYTGGLFISNPTFKNLWIAEPRAYLLGQDKVYPSV